MNSFLPRFKFEEGNWRNLVKEVKNELELVLHSFKNHKFFSPNALTIEIFISFYEVN